MPHANPLLDDISDDDIADALLNGNMRGEKSRAKKLEINPIPFERWTSQGYFAAVTKYICRCGSVNSVVHNIFHKETTPSGGSRAIGLHIPTMQIPLDRGYPVTIAEHKVAVCSECIEANGFSLNNIAR